MDERDPRLDERAGRFAAYLESLLADERPSPDVIDDRDEAEMARTAAELAGASSAGTDPDPSFVDQLRIRMRRADEALETVRVPPPVRERPEPGGIGRARLSRRALLQAGLGAAAGLAAGAAGVALTRPEQRTPVDAPPAASDTPLVGGDGFWTDVAMLDDLPDGTARRFSTAAFDGFVVNDGGEVRALSAICTHMGCTLRFRPEQQDLRCPCHGASFDLAGRLANGSAAWGDRGGYAGDDAAYPIDLPDLARPRVKVEDGRIWVWTAQV
ncbi:MAG TPA: Rieske (2Fe-2S) protein [Candidatus Angelobacter sp.]|nr:Rieske (2Fe-2S) protein [Candidatus Angelobacter sp.]